MCSVWFSVRAVVTASEYELSRGWDCVMFRLRCGRSGAKIPQGRQGPMADRSPKFGAGVEK
jgi:hypothetical protein